LNVILGSRMASLSTMDHIGVSRIIFMLISS